MAKTMTWPIKTMTWGDMVDSINDKNLRDGIDNHIIAYTRSGIKWLGNILERYREDYKIETFPYFQLSHSIYEQPWQALLVSYDLRTIWNYKEFSENIQTDISHNKQDKILFETQIMLYKNTVGKAAENTTRKNVILTRDPRDVVVSYYYKNIIQGPKGCIDRVVYNNKFGIRNIVEFMNIWAEVMRMNSNYIHVTYEDLFQYPELELVKILNHWGIPIYEYVLRDAIEKSSFENMQKRELKETKENNGLAIDKNQLHIRKGGVGGYKDELLPETIEYINKYIKENLDGAFRRYIQ